MPISRISVCEDDLETISRLAKELQSIWNEPIKLMQAQEKLAQLLGYRNMHELQMEAKTHPLTESLRWPTPAGEAQISEIVAARLSTMLSPAPDISKLPWGLLTAAKRARWIVQMFSEVEESGDGEIELWPVHDSTVPRTIYAMALTKAAAVPPAKNRQVELSFEEVRVAAGYSAIPQSKREKERTDEIIVKALETLTTIKVEKRGPSTIMTRPAISKMYFNVKDETIHLTLSSRSHALLNRKE